MAARRGKRRWGWFCVKSSGLIWDTVLHTLKAIFHVPSDKIGITLQKQIHDENIERTWSWQKILRETCVWHLKHHMFLACCGYVFLRDIRRSFNLFLQGYQNVLAIKVEVTCGIPACKRLLITSKKVSIPWQQCCYKSSTSPETCM